MKKGNTSNPKRRYNDSLEKQSLINSGYHQQTIETTGRYSNIPTAHKKNKRKGTPNLTRVQNTTPIPKGAKPAQLIEVLF